MEGSAEPVHTNAKARSTQPPSATCSSMAAPRDVGVGDAGVHNQRTRRTAMRAVATSRSSGRASRWSRTSTRDPSTAA